MAPIFFKKIPLLNSPVDFGKKFKGKPIFGKNKTWRGIIIAPFMGLLIFFLQQQLYGVELFRNLSLIEYSHFSIWFGFVMGLGAILGDLVKSYFKRQEGIKSGKSWPIYDQIDFVAGGLLFSFFFHVPDALVAFIIFLASPVLHFLVNTVAFRLGIR
tara:strand:- start:627 stop:1097 length:471 start_codon:yes stop_codon:yes gene_type:complete